ncbi:MAG: hypothetical protein OEZ33_11805 [Gammaproteobacteria bacterium]|nr:hypothetical protein [Gammaproteobacteria bacterium]MDH5778891.1 hypothetical protein [Gammaproteobacteria bacterium]
MATEARIYQHEGHGWFIEIAGHTAGPLDSANDAREYLHLVEKTRAARTECACLESECL